jgi:hypothetical protein
LDRIDRITGLTGFGGGCELAGEEVVAGAGGFLAVGEGWEFEVEEVAEGGGVLFEGVLGGFLEGGPAGPGVMGGVMDVAELAEPLDVGA